MLSHWFVSVPRGLVNAWDGCDVLSRPFLSASDSLAPSIYVSLIGLLNEVGGMGGFDPSSTCDLSAYRRTHDLALSRHDLLKDQ